MYWIISAEIGTENRGNLGKDGNEEAENYQNHAEDQLYIVPSGSRSALGCFVNQRSGNG